MEPFAPEELPSLFPSSAHLSVPVLDASIRALISNYVTQDQGSDSQTLLSPPEDSADPESPSYEPRDITREASVQVLKEPLDYTHDLTALMEPFSDPAPIGPLDQEIFEKYLNGDVELPSLRECALSAYDAVAEPDNVSEINLRQLEHVPIGHGHGHQHAHVELQRERQESERDEPELVISLQPECRSFLKSASTDAPRVEVQLRLPHALPACAVGPVSVFSSVRALTLENEPQSLDDQRRARFELRFGKSGCITPCSVFFEVELVLGTGERRTLTSALSEPFILRTNISQFMKAERLLLQQLAFKSESCPVEWSHLSKLLSRHIFASTGNVRAPTSRDIRFLHRQLGGSELIAPEPFERFWNLWYGEVARLFTDKNVKLLWTRRVLMGFVTRDDLFKLLTSTHSRRPGLFVVAFVDKDVFPVVAWLHCDLTVRINTLKRTDLREPFRLLLGRAQHLSHMLRPSAQNAECFEMTPKEDVIRLLQPKKGGASAAAAAATPCASPTSISLSSNHIVASQQARVCVSPQANSEPAEAAAHVQYDDELH